MGSNHHTLISKGTRIVGEVHFSGELNVQGQVVGNIIADGNSELEIAQSGQIEGQIHVPKVIVRGLVQGDIRCSKHLELGATAVVNGNVFYTLIEMVKGSQVNGSLVYVSETEPKKKASAAT
ncbi:polymer-forming cytoskeletal protein [Saccharophagus sp. K07]|jgi:cytoskeletal protein CcmA (bactofilin family)|uniref:bactofilin family protein n=1 Tax=Saccharophagus sp. K07 TaxID=2283636 RepID=UPI0016526F74|nr:polymer-forming cytoskeletal protein [Saccharophagus sp. K07]MBC6905377.1 polymer-forming cytoskeletal protein [Saccharophagus sp. K07]